MLQQLLKKNSHFEGENKLDITRPAYLEINLNNLEFNIEHIKNKVGKNVKLMPVIKASGYGTYINQRLDQIEEAKKQITTFQENW